MTQVSVAAIILAAGASRRLGQPKQLVQLGPETLLERAVRVAEQAGCAPVLVVLGSEADLILSRCNLTGAHVLINHRWPEGMASSVHTAVNALLSPSPGPQIVPFRPERKTRSEETCISPPPISGAILMVCDQPAVTPQHLRALTGTGTITASSYAGRHGVPAFFPAAVFPQLAQLTGDSGARDLLRPAPAIPLTDGELDIDTPDALEAARSVFAPYSGYS